jgi:hypothetical protein
MTTTTTDFTVEEYPDVEDPTQTIIRTTFGTVECCAKYPKGTPDSEIKDLKAEAKRTLIRNEISKLEDRMFWLKHQVVMIDVRAGLYNKILEE